MIHNMPRTKCEDLLHKIEIGFHVLTILATKRVLYGSDVPCVFELGSPARITKRNNFT